MQSVTGKKSSLFSFLFYGRCNFIEWFVHTTSEQNQDGKQNYAGARRGQNKDAKELIKRLLIANPLLDQ